MEKIDVCISNEKIECLIIRKRIKHLYLKIKEETIVISAPLKTSKKLINDVIERKKEWIYNGIIKQRKKETKKINLLKNNYIYLLGKKVDVYYFYTDIKNINIEFSKLKCNIYIPLALKNKDNLYLFIENKLDIEMKNIANKKIIEIMEDIIKLTGLVPNKIIIKKFKRIWGNCSSNKVIKINQNIIWYDEREIKYVCLHELCHLKYMNHKKEFWNMLKKYMPDYKESINKLKE